ncbi:MAG: glycine/betaine ABC transporter substrate-binding protein, partial [Actinomycetota bacterium]|nr:glycine/betaine ABC transporter substrate-binding protein [Actinomycetota bacterium]
MTPIHRIPALAGVLATLLTAALVLASCGPREEGGGQRQAGGQAIARVPAAEGKEITIGSKNFTEQYILGEIYAQALEAAGFKVKKQLDLGSEQIAFKALKGGQIDAYPEYTGTSLTSFFDVKTERVPKDPHHAYQDTKAAYAREDITALPPTKFENTYRLGGLRETLDRLRVRTTSDLGPKSKDLTVTAYPECAQRDDCLLGVNRTYGTRFKDVVKSESPYEVLDAKEADIGFLFTTDAQLTLPKYGILEDDRKFFPPYNVSLGIRNDALRKIGPEGQRVLEQVQGPLTVEVM